MTEKNFCITLVKLSCVALWEMRGILEGLGFLPTSKICPASHRHRRTDLRKGYSFPKIDFERLIENMKKTQCITERLKEENSLEWVQRLNNIRACAREIVNEEIIYA